MKEGEGEEEEEEKEEKWAERLTRANAVSKPGERTGIDGVALSRCLFPEKKEKIKENKKTLVQFLLDVVRDSVSTPDILPHVLLTASVPLKLSCLCCL